MKPLRYVVIGIGAGIFYRHRLALDLGLFELVGATDVVAENGRRNAEDVGVPFFETLDEMIAETQPDAAVVLTPHPFHAEVTIKLLQAGICVLVEKPIAVRVSEADAMIAAAERSGRTLAVNFQHRARGEVRTLARLINNGDLGQIQHINMVAAWPRTKTYYAGGAWRGTWKGEGGGVLMNQAPHNLDLICFLLGLPKSVFAWTRNLIHDIDPEDTVQAMCEWESGALGSIHITTATAGLPETLEVVGTKGSTQIVERTLVLRQLDEDFAVTARESTESLPAIAAHQAHVALEEGEGHHLDVYRNFYEAVVNGAPLLADGAQGRESLELANAMILSSHENRPVNLPVDREQYDHLLDRLIEQSND